MRPDRDIRQVEHELRCFTHIKQLGHKVDFSDIEDAGSGKKFDLIVEATRRGIEVECKTIKYDAGSQIKEQLSVSLIKAFQGHALKHTKTTGSGLFVFQLKRPSDKCKNLDVRLREILRLSADLPYDCEDFSFTFIPKPDWQADWDAKRFEQLRRKLKAKFGDESHCSLDGGNRIVGASFLPHAPSALADHTVEVIHEASGQCTGTRPCVVWIHFVGLSQSDFMEIINASKDGKGLNAVASMGIFDDRGPEGRDHVERIRFTADSDQLVGHQVRGPEGSPVNAVSVAGVTYDVPNPKCRFPAIERI